MCTAAAYACVLLACLCDHDETPPFIDLPFIDLPFIDLPFIEMRKCAMAEPATLTWGQSTVDLLAELAAAGVQRKVVLVRHSAREFVAGRHDLENPLTDDGRAAASAFGAALPTGFQWRGYASPAERCQDTAKLALQAHEQMGGLVTRVRPMEGLGVFYALDQMKMFRIMQGAGGLGPFLSLWISGAVPPDVMLNPQVAANAIGRMLLQKLDEPGTDRRSADLLVSHDMSLGLVRECLLGQSWDRVGAVQFLDGLVAYRDHAGSWLVSPHGERVPLHSA